MPVDDRGERERIFGEIAESLAAAHVQQIGKLLVLFRPAPVESPEELSAPRSSSRPTPRRTSAAAMPGSARPGTRPERREIETVNRVPAPRRDPGKAKRAAGKINVPRKTGRTR